MGAHPKPLPTGRLAGGLTLLALLAAIGLPSVEAQQREPVLKQIRAEPFRGVICVFPIEQLNPLSLAQGATEPEVDALFGVRSTPTQRQQHDWCVRYQYSGSLSYTLLFRQGTVDSIWLTEGTFVPYLCEGIVVRTVGVPPRSW